MDSEQRKHRGVGVGGVGQARCHGGIEQIVVIVEKRPEILRRRERQKGLGLPAREHDSFAQIRP
jgi:hypothetical protein